ncbi:hypothetical protein RJD24_12175 [Bacillaceae bacterium IKA-2]|nr:hypothetical protein RJD24_12175 [Bacillaceae bacterium IKA-2]
MEEENEDIVKKYLFQVITLMLDKTAGQRTQIESVKFNNCHLATPTIIDILINRRVV